MDSDFMNAANALGEPFYSLLAKLPKEITQQATEISLRLTKSVVINAGSKAYFITKAGCAVDQNMAELYRPSEEEINRSLFRLCDYSLHSHQRELAEGYITLPGGHRAGISGNAVYDEQHRLSSVKNVTSIRLRIARHIEGAADRFSGSFTKETMRSVLFAGPPGSGKTTILRDLASALSGGRYGSFYNVALADERGELSACLSQNSLCLDSIRDMPKATAVLQAVRTLRPDIVICDEIGGMEEAESFVTTVNSGVTIIASIHANSEKQLQNKPQFKLLQQHCVFDEIYFIKGFQDGIYRVGHMSV